MPTTGIQPTSQQALTVVASLGVFASSHGLQVEAVTLMSPPCQPGAAQVDYLWITAEVTDLDRRHPATAPAVQKLLRSMGAAWDDIGPHSVKAGRRSWTARLAGLGMRLTVSTEALVPMQPAAVSR